MGARKGPRVAIVSVVAVVVLIGAVAWFGREQIRFALTFESIGRNAQGYVEYRHRQTGIVFVSLPGGTFAMGGSQEDVDQAVREFEADGWQYSQQAIALASAQLPRHVVILSPFLIAKYEVTQAEWTAAVGYNPSKRRGDDLPVEMVSWEDCRKFCELTDLSLPTEAQWEYACRGGAQGRWSGTGSIDEMGWHLANSGDRTHPVGEKAPNGFGLHDMHGNVSESCADVFDPEFYSSREAGEPDPQCNSGSGARVRRGGSYYCHAAACSSVSRNSHPRSVRRDDRGFRPAFYPLP